MADLAKALTDASSAVQDSLETLQTTVAASAALVDAVRRTIRDHGEEVTMLALQTAPMLTQLRAGSRWNLDMASRGAMTEEVEGACVLRFPRKPGNRCEITFVSGEVELTTRH